MREPLLNDLELLAKLFADGGWRELRVTSDDFEILLSYDSAARLDGSAIAVSAVPAARPALPPTAPTRSAKPVELAAPAPAPAAIDPGWTAITAPNLGTFYRSPKPGSLPFVQLGQTVGEDTEICLIEVMKLCVTDSRAFGACGCAPEWRCRSPR